MDVAKTGAKDQSDVYRIVKKVYSPYFNKEIDVRVILFDLSDSPVKTAYAVT